VLTKTVGCGRVELSAGYAFEGNQYFYRETDGSWIGAAYWSDVPIAACNAAPTGVDAQPCASTKACAICGQYEGMAACAAPPTQ